MTQSVTLTGLKKNKQIYYQWKIDNETQQLCVYLEKLDNHKDNQ